MSRLNIISISLILSGIVLVIWSCQKKESESNFQTTPLELKVPPGFPSPENWFTNNPLTQEGFDLGKKLFYDGRLSADGNFPCGSCHQQFAGFATFDHSLSHGFNDQFTTRNAQPLFNLAWNKTFHWDGGINHLEVEPLAPINAPNEMAETMDNIIRKLQKDNVYPQMFNKAFGNPEINSQRMLWAIAQFMGMMISANSKYDQMKRGETTFTDAEQRGYQLFQQKCANCHQEPLFTDHTFRNIGLAMDPTLRDRGRMQITNDRSDSLKFRVPSLRNIMVTGPYTHDGRFLSVGAMIDHYRSGVINGPTTDSLLRNRIQLDDFQKNDLIIFLRTLTDNSFLTDKRFSAN